MTPEKLEAHALSLYIQENHNDLKIPGPEIERLQYLRTKILQNESASRLTKNMA